jgi:peptide-methionine (S)-S-oxide reductase
VVRTRVGYAGGTKKNPTYHSLEDHAETLQIEFDPSRISFKELLGIFRDSHDPASRSWSRQYMSAIFFHNDEQKRLAVETMNREASMLKRKVFTEIVPFTEFYMAEDYHQKYALQHNPDLMEEFRAMYPSFERFVASTAAARVNGYLAGCGTLKDLLEEIDSYGLSSPAADLLLGIAKRPVRLQCSTSARN